MNEKIFQDLIDYYTPKMTPAKAAIYLRMLEGVDSDDLRRAADHWMKTEEWFPRVSQLLQTVDKLNDIEQGAVYSDPRRMFWRAMGVRNAVLREEMSPEALKVYPQFFDLRPNEHQAGQLGEWWE